MKTTTILQQQIAAVSVLMLVSLLASCVSSNVQHAASDPTSNATMQSGQWEFVATPSSGAHPVYVEVNLNVGSGSIFATVFNTGLFQYGGSIGGQFTDCSNYTINASMSNGIFTGSINSPGSSTISATFSGATLASNGQSVSSGSYSDMDLCGLVPDNSTGTFTGYVVTPLSGTFSGTLTGAGSDQIALQVTQDSNFGITASGSATDAGVVSNLSISPAGSASDNTGGYSNVIGATLQANGTSVNASGTSKFQVFGHSNPTGTQIQIVVFDQAGTETGTLTKQ